VKKMNAIRLYYRPVENGPNTQRDNKQASEQQYNVSFAGLLPMHAVQGKNKRFFIAFAGKIFHTSPVFPRLKEAVFLGFF